MATIITDELKSDISCCVADLDYNTALKTKRGQAQDACILTAIIKTAQVKIMNEYIPNGTLLVEGYTTDATVDLSTASVGIPISGLITVGEDPASETPLVIGIIPEDTYATTQDLVTAVVDAINAMTGTTGFTAVDNGDLTVTIYAPPGSGTALNGTIISVILNPQFAITTIDQGSTYAPRGVTYVDDPTDPLYGYFFVTNTTLTVGVYKVLVIVNGVIQTSLTTGLTGTPFGITYNADEDNVVIGTIGPPGLIYTLENDYPIFTQLDTSPIFLGAVYGEYNTVDDHSYFAGTSNNLFKVAADGTVTTIPLIAANYVIHNSTNGDVWVVGGPNIRIVNTAGATIASINVPGASFGVPYYDAATNQFYVPQLLAGVGTIDIYDATGVVVTPNWFTSTGFPIQIKYSSLYNLWFLATSTYIQIIRTDATLKQNILFPCNLITEDVKYGRLYATATGSHLADRIAHIYFTNDGEEEFTETMSNGTPDVYQEEADQCVPEEDINAMVQDLNSDCQNCPGSTTSVTPTPAGTQYTIYYGNSTDQSVDATQLQALTAIVQSGYAGTYSFGATAPSEFKIIGWPAVLGTPASFIDPSTGFDIAMATIYSVTVNSVLYSVAATYYELGGAIDIQVSA